MNTKQTPPIDETNYNKVIQLILANKFRAAEQLVLTKMSEAGARTLEQAMNEVANYPESVALVQQYRATEHYRSIRKTHVQVTVAGEQKIKVISYYGLAEKKKKGRPKKGRNGTGTHILLAHWGFSRKRSPGSIDEIVRTGSASASYDLAAKQLQAQRIAVSSYGVGSLVSHVGTTANPQRATHHFALATNESLAGKRVSISLDGGRIRSRKNKTGRPTKEQKRTRYETDWKEPKLLVIAELDENGMKRKGTKPLYEATMGGKAVFAELLVGICKQLHLSEATEIVCLGDGAPVLWDIFATLQTTLHIKGKTTEVVDFFHACEHITELTQAHTKKTEKQQKQWFKKLKQLLREGKFRAFEASIRTEAKKHDLPELTRQLGYFLRHKTRMRYDRYEKAHLPIGSGIVESAVRRVVNGRLKAPGSFWKEENAESMLTVRCALLADRWDDFMENFRLAVGIGGC